MQVKKFEAQTMQEALNLVKSELGPEAIILSTKNHRKGFGLLSKASVEVTAAVAERTLLKKKVTEKVMKSSITEQIQKFPAGKQSELYDRVGEYYIEKAKARIQARKEREAREDEKEQRRRDRNTTANNRTTDLAAAPAESKRYIDITDDDNEVTKKTVSNNAAMASNYARNGKVYTEAPESHDRIIPQPKYSDQNFENSRELALVAEVEQLKSMLEELKSEQALYSDSRIAEKSSDAIFSEFQNLLRNGVEKKYASQLTKELTVSLPRESQRDADRVLDALAVELMNGIRIEQSLEFSSGQRKAIALVGATGVGKTTTIAKLASQALLTKGLKVGLINIDSYKVSASDQLATYAKILGVPFRNASNSAELERALAEFKPMDLVLVDTSGRSQRDTENLNEMKKILSENGIETLLILSAPTRDQELYDILGRFKIFDPRGVIFSKLDECSTYGCIYNVAQRSGLPLTYFTVGQRVPEDIEPASRERLASLILDI